MSTVFKGTETNYTTIDAPFEPAPNNSYVSGAAISWPQSPYNGGLSSYWRVYTGTISAWYYASSLAHSAAVGPGTVLTDYYLHRIARYHSEDIWYATIQLAGVWSNSNTKGIFYFDYADYPSANTVRKMMILTDDSPIDITNFTARIVKWEQPTSAHTLNSLDEQLKDRWLVSDDYTLATYYATNTPSSRTSDFEGSVTATYSTDGPGGYILQSPQSLVLGLSGFATDVMFGGQQVSSIHLNGKKVWYSSIYRKIRTTTQQEPVITSSDYPENILIFAQDTKNLLYYTGGRWHIVSHDGLRQIVVVESQSEATSSGTYTLRNSKAGTVVPDNSLLYAKDTANLLIYMGGKWHIIEN